MYHGLDTAITTGSAITRLSQLLEYWFYEYCGVGHTIVKEERLQQLTDKNATLRRRLDSVNDQQHAHDLHLRMGSDVRVVPLPPGGGAMTRQRGSGPRTRGCSTSRRGRVFSMSIRTYYLSVRINLHNFALKSFIRIDPKSVRTDFALRNLFTIWYYTLLSTPQPQMSSSSSDSSIGDPPGISSSSFDNLILDCAAAICILHQAAMNIVVYDATSSHGRNVMGRKDKRKK
ncbi:hypothetical protein GIB67_000706 [Kingdonia uniflora]|uniref:Uncharacterized protein n=1 Tax=Kingdonia uniflora TaxID=39325 RepID=A0A7J7NDR5_9MAGN|nr:hypothetical protein GIB67_000706 [Kingdonia uniflora]